MSFFEPPPPPPPPTEHRWAPPLWDRPSEGVVPAILPVREFVHRSDEVVALVDQLRVYPNGFTISVVIRTNPRRSREEEWQRRGHRADFPRVGVRFADGRTAGREPMIGFMTDGPKDEAGIPTSPILRSIGGGGGSHEFQWHAWVFPLPPDGPVEVFVALPHADGEGRAVIDGARIRAAADEAIVVWA